MSRASSSARASSSTTSVSRASSRHSRVSVSRARVARVAPTRAVSDVDVGASDAERDARARRADVREGESDAEGDDRLVETLARDARASASTSFEGACLPREPSTRVVAELKRATRELGATRGANVAARVFDEMSRAEREGSWPNAHVCTTVISSLAATGDADKALEVLAWMKATSARGGDGAKMCAPTTHTYTTCVRALDAAGRWKEALGMFEEMKTTGTRRNAHTYSALVRAGANGGRAGARAAVKLIPEMKKDSIEPDLAIASAVISAFGVLGSEDNARAMLRAIESSGRGTDAKLYVDYITAMCRCGNYEEATEVFSRVPRTTFTCTAVMKAYAETMDWQLAETLFVEMRRDGPPPNDRTHTAILHAYEKSLQWERAVRLLNELTAERRAKEIHHNIVLSVLGKCTQWERAEVLFRDMRELYGIQPSRVTYSTLISAYGRSGKTELAREVFRQMLARRIPPDDYTFVGLMLGPALDGNFRECARIATEMKEEYGVEHTVHTYNALIQAADIAGNYDKAVEVYDELLRRGVEPNNTTRELVVAVGKRGANYYDRQQKTAAVASYAAGLVGVMGMALGRW